jgi:hypothetical protein
VLYLHQSLCKKSLVTIGQDNDQAFLDRLHSINIFKMPLMQFLYNTTPVTLKGGGGGGEGQVFLLASDK